MIRHDIPRYSTMPSDTAYSWWGAVESAQKRLKVPLLEWQADIVKVITELNSDGTPVHKRSLISVPRQQGKTWAARTMMLAMEEHLEPGSIVGYTAQSRMSAAQRVVEAGIAYLQAGLKMKVTKGIGNERVLFPNGTQIIPISPTDTAGAGFSLDGLIVDELWAVTEATMGTVLPTIVARPHAQIISISTMGDLDSTVMNRWVEQGRDGEIAYWEWSVPEGADIFDEEEWWKAMPSLGLTVSVEAV